MKIKANLHLTAGERRIIRALITRFSPELQNTGDTVSKRTRGPKRWTVSKTENGYSGKLMSRDNEMFRDFGREFWIAENFTVEA